MIFLVALRKELLEQWRSYRVLVVVVLSVFGLMPPLFAKFTPEMMKPLPDGDQIAGLIPPPTTVADAVVQYLKNISQFAVILALLMTMEMMAQEKDKGTAALMLVKPIPCPAFLWAKFVAQGVTFLVGVAIASVACYYYTWILFEPQDVLGWLAQMG